MNVYLSVQLTQFLLQNRKIVWVNWTRFNDMFRSWNQVCEYQMYNIYDLLYNMVWFFRFSVWWCVRTDSELTVTGVNCVNVWMTNPCSALRLVTLPIKKHLATCFSKSCISHCNSRVSHLRSTFKAPMWHLY